MARGLGASGSGTRGNDALVSRQNLPTIDGQALNPTQQLEAALTEMKDKWLRSEAEMVNLRARTKREVEDARLYAVQKFAKDVVEVAENMRRGIDSLPPPAEDEPELLTKMRDGFEGIERSFVGLLERNGIARNDPTGAMFDPNMHQAMAEQETLDYPPGMILQAWSYTWTLHGRLLKPGMVVVAKAYSGNAPVDEMA